MNSGSPPWMHIAADGLSIEVLARPGASKSEILRVDPRGLVIAVAAPPARGKANAELVQLIAKVAGVPRSEVTVIKGASARRKTIRILSSEPSVPAARLIAAGTRR